MKSVWAEPFPKTKMHAKLRAKLHGLKWLIFSPVERVYRKRMEALMAQRRPHHRRLWEQKLVNRVWGPKHQTLFVRPDGTSRPPLGRHVHYGARWRRWKGKD